MLHRQHSAPQGIQLARARLFGEARHRRYHDAAMVDLMAWQRFGTNLCTNGNFLGVLTFGA